VSPGRVDLVRVHRHLVALDEILARLAPHMGHDVSALAINGDERWSVELRTPTLG
jgi:hypothetical protein